MRKFLGIIVCAGLTGCQALQVDPGSDGASVLSLRLGTVHHEDKKAAPGDDNGTGLKEGTYEAYLTTAYPQGMASPMAPAHTIQAIIPGPNGPSVAYLQFPDGDPTGQAGYDYGAPRAPWQPPAMQAVVNAPAPTNPAVRAIQNELTEKICQEVLDLKQQVQDLTAQVKARPEPTRDGAVAAIAANVGALNRQVTKLNEALTSLKAGQQKSTSAASSDAAPPEAPVQAATPVPSPIRPVSAQSVQPPLFAANEPVDLTQKEVNMLVTQCVFELKAQIRDLNARLAKFSGATKSEE